jgi:Helix-turn-helix domain
MNKKITIPAREARTNITGLPSNRLLVESEAAAHLRVSKSFLAKKRCSGGGPLFVKIGRRVLYRLSDLEEFTEQGKRRSTSDCAAA